MSRNQIHDALLAVRESVDVPALDEVAFHRHLRDARRARLARRAAAAAVVLAAIGVVPLIGLRGPAGPPPATRPTAPESSPAPASQIIPLALHGRLRVLLPDGSSYSTPIRVESVLGIGPAGIVVVAHDSHLLLVGLKASGQPEEPRDIGDGHPVDRSWLDKTGKYVAFVDVLGQLHVRAVGSDADLQSPTRLTPQQTPLAVDGSHSVFEESGTVTAYSSGHSFQLATSAAPVGAQIGGSTLAYQTAAGVEFFDLTDGRQGAKSAGTATGALSPDGVHYVAAAGKQQRAAGASADWYVIDPGSGQRTVFAGRPARAEAIAMTWQDDDRFLVLATDGRQPGNRIVWDCSMTTERCVERYNDASDTAQIPTR